MKLMVTVKGIERKIKIGKIYSDDIDIISSRCMKAINETFEKILRK